MVPEVLSMAEERGYRDIMEDKEKPRRENLVIDKKKAPLEHIANLLVVSELIGIKWE